MFTPNAFSTLPVSPLSSTRSWNAGSGLAIRRKINTGLSF